MKSNFILRLESSIKRALSEIINFKLKNNVGMVTITDCDLTTDLEFLKVYYTVLIDKDKKKAREGLESSKGFIRSELIKMVQMRKAPKITFLYDDSYKTGERIEELLMEAKQKEIKS